MGKNSKNEGLKLSATFCNNVAVVLVATAFAVPFYTFMVKTQKEIQDLADSMTPQEMFERGIGLFAVLGLAAILHGLGRLILYKLED